jgi:Putative zinc-finger
VNTVNCPTVQDLLPEFARDELGPVAAATVRRHVADCDECRTELELVRLLTEPVTTPAGLEDRLVGAVHARPVTRRGSMRYYAVAATFVMALVAASVVLRRIGESRPAETPADALVAIPILAWPDGGDPLLHGSPGLQALSESELLKLLQELES